MKPETEPRHVKLTRFLCQELLFEYATGQLERNRERDVDEYLASDPNAQHELENLKKGAAYAEGLAEIGVSPSLHHALLGFEPQWKKRLQAWTLWSSQRGWRVLPYAFLMLAIVLGVAVTQPWHSRKKQDLVLVVQKQNEMALSEAQPLGAQPPSPILVEAKSVQPPLAAVHSLPAAPSTQEVPAPTASPESPAPAKSPSADVAKEEDKADSPIPGTGKGMLYRGELTVPNLQVASASIRDKIQSAGGKAAGSVELGWLRRSNEAYFHFSLPESNYADLEAFLKTFGPVRISRERHPRVMPEGQIRIILTVKDGGESHEGEAEAP